jgi:CheY-like chemotaxis protein
MNLTAQLLELKKEKSDLTLAERAELSCRLAKQLEKAGEYEAACEALSEFWPDRDAPPKLNGLENPTKAEILLEVGALAGWLGSAHQAEGSQEAAKNLITKSVEIFESCDLPERVAEARTDLALCYWREGAFDEARVILGQVIGELGNAESEIKAIALIRSAIVEKTAARYSEALNKYKEAEPLVRAINDHALKGTFHNGLATLLNCRGLAEKREDYIDQALIEFAAASFHFEKAGNRRYLARVENNLGYLFHTIGRYKEAHDHLDRARRLFVELNDAGTVAQIDDNRARTLLAESRFTEAERFARLSVRALEKGGEQALLAEALTTYGIVLARLGHQPRSKALLERAIEVAETAGDLEAAGRTRLSIIEELGDKLSIKELISIYRQAIDVLKGSQDAMTGKRSMSCSAKLLDVIERLEPKQGPPETTWEGFSLREHVRTGERAVIERALRDSEGSVTRASRLLGFKHHQPLISLISSRHKDLLTTRSPVRKRRRHISKRKKIRKRSERQTGEAHGSQVSILHVEDYPMVAKLISEVLEAEDFHIDLCVDGDAALRKLTGDDHYDVLIIDNSLPGLSGLDLVQRARKITHRRRTPIIMLSGDDIEKEAWRAGVDEFLRKPQDISRVCSTVERLLAERKDKTD